jgi:transcriptional regulator with XRE-family HTH domain
MATKKRSERIDGARLRAHRGRCGFTQAALADRVHITSRWLMALENGTQIGGEPPRVSRLVLEALAAALGVEANDLVATEPAPATVTTAAV